MPAGMGYLETYLDQRHIPYEMIHINQGPVSPCTQDVLDLFFWEALMALTPVMPD
jgi:hypothetical protein